MCRFYIKRKGIELEEKSWHKYNLVYNTVYILNSWYFYLNSFLPCKLIKQQIVGTDTVSFLLIFKWFVFTGGL